MAILLPVQVKQIMVATHALHYCRWSPCLIQSLQFEFTIAKFYTSDQCNALCIVLKQFTEQSLLQIMVYSRVPFFEGYKFRK